jgi:hypothetical protein
MWCRVIWYKFTHFWEERAGCMQQARIEQEFRSTNKASEYTGVPYNFVAAAVEILRGRKPAVQTPTSR